MPMMMMLTHSSISIMRVRMLFHQCFSVSFCFTVAPCLSCPPAPRRAARPFVVASRPPAHKRVTPKSPPAGSAGGLLRPVVRALSIFADAQRQGVLGLDHQVQQHAWQCVLDLLVLWVFPEVHELVGVAVAVIQLAVRLHRVVGQLVMAAGDGLDVEAPVVAGEHSEGVIPPCAAV